MSKKLDGETGNYIAEYFGYRVYPKVADGVSALEAQKHQQCPFLGLATGKKEACTKRESSRGVCTVSTVVDKIRHDWLVCPNRALDPGFMGQAARRLFGYNEDVKMSFIAAPALSDKRTQENVKETLDAGEIVLVYFQQKLGGELSVSKTSFSPEFSFDWTLVELLKVSPEISLGKFGILELQTMDFHGSYKHATIPLREKIEVEPESFHGTLQGFEGKNILSRKIEGPNLSNVFKRTFYQMAYKFQLAGHENFSGGGFAVPYSVWTSWSRHLAEPRMKKMDDGTYVLVPERGSKNYQPTGNSWIFVFTLDDSIDSRAEINNGGIRMWRAIRTDAETLTKLALKESPARVLVDGNTIPQVAVKAKRKIESFWPEAKNIQNSTLF
ncbi:hypothetical protein ACFV4I_14850 [Nocardiopsis alba]|uniref:hypothetical protein n=1 Tax=Nocardiopsis alba TaxID=53437 RepID=UPI003654969A